MKWNIGTLGDVESAREGLVIALDLGFGRSSTRSCGLAWKNAGEAPPSPAERGNRVHGFNFAGACRQLGEILGAPGVTTAVLIVEAPLSVLFDADGNPTPRAAVELRRKRRGGGTLETSGFETIADGAPKMEARGWYQGAGAATLLGATFLLTHIEQALASRPLDLWLFEAFASFKDGRRVADWREAAEILQVFHREPPASPHFITLPDSEPAPRNLVHLRDPSVPPRPPLVIDLYPRHRY